MVEWIMRICILMLGCKGLRKKERKSNNSPNFSMKVFIAVLLIQQNLKQFTTLTIFV